MNRLFCVATLATLSLTGSVIAQQQGNDVQDKVVPVEQAEEWVKQMRVDALKMKAEGDRALAAGDERTALNRYTATHEIYKATFTAEELKSLGDQITALRTKLGVTGHEVQPSTAPAQADLNNPAVATKRTEGLQMLSEAEQYLEEGKFNESGRLFTRLHSKYRAVLMPEEATRVSQGLMTSRERLGLPPLPPGQADFMPYVAKTGDEEIDSLCLLMSGTFTSQAAVASSDSAVKLTFSSAAVPVKGLTNAVYFEVAREDDPANPFRQGIFSIYRMDKQMRLRIFDIADDGVRNCVVSLWAATDAFPTLSLDDLAVNADLTLVRNADGSGYEAHTSGRVPTAKAGAMLMTSQIKIDANGVAIDDHGYDAAGKEVWNSGAQGGVMFARTPAPNIVTRKDSGLIIIDLVPGGSGEPLVRGGEVAMHFSYWAATGTMVGTSRVPNRPPQRVRYPVNFLPGLDEGLDGIKANARRRFVIPPDLAWGAQGNSWQVPPNTSVVFDVECLWVQAPLAPPAQGPVGPTEEGPQPSPAVRPTGGGN